MKIVPLACIVIASALLPSARATENPAAIDPDYVPCRMHQKRPAVYPIRLLQQGVLHGEATIVLEIAPDGRVADQLITAYTHPDFAAEVKRAIANSTFEPARIKDQPITSIVTTTFEFGVNGIVVYERRFDTIRHDEYVDRKFAYFAHGASALDAKPQLAESKPPVYPKSWMDEGRAGTVTVRFYIDEEGRTRLPVAVSSGDDYLASAATAAVKEWRFQPPTSHGEPVLAHAEQVFVFSPPAKNGGTS